MGAVRAGAVGGHVVFVGVTGHQYRIPLGDSPGSVEVVVADIFALYRAGRLSACRTVNGAVAPTLNHGHYPTSVALSTGLGSPMAMAWMGIGILPPTHLAVIVAYSLCRNCHHPRDKHRDLDLKCSITILTNWDEAARLFAGDRSCDCPGYCGTGLDAPCRTDCPHEYVEDDPKCVCCGRPAPASS